MNEKAQVTVIGGGLAGSEAAWQAAQRGVKVRLCERRPVRSTPAHKTSNFGEVVCSNSLKSDEKGTAPYMLKEELRRGGSLLIDAAHQTSVRAHSPRAGTQGRSDDGGRTEGRTPVSAETRSAGAVCDDGVSRP